MTPQLLEVVLPVPLLLPQTGQASRWPVFLFVCIKCCRDLGARQTELTG